MFILAAKSRQVNLDSYMNKVELFILEEDKLPILNI